MSKPLLLRVLETVSGEREGEGKERGEERRKEQDLICCLAEWVTMAFTHGTKGLYTHKFSRVEKLSLPPQQIEGLALERPLLLSETRW